MKNVTRRHMLVSSALSFGSLSLRSLITGLPSAFLLGSYEQALAQTSGAKFLIVSHLTGADPVNSNVPGCYASDPTNADDPLNQIQHPLVAELGAQANGWETGTQFSMGNKQVRGGAEWAALPADLRSRMAFWHQ